MNGLKFGVSLSNTLQNGKLPEVLVDMLVYVAKEAVTTTELFRKPGNQVHMKLLQQLLSEGEKICFDDFAHYTLASVIKQFLLLIPGGLLGRDIERQLLGVLGLHQRIEQRNVMSNMITNLPEHSQKLLVLLIGMWFRVANHAEINHMTTRNIAISVAGSMFHSCVENQKLIRDAVQVLVILIDDFGVPQLFGKNNLKYFTSVTQTGLCVTETYCYSAHQSQSLAHPREHLDLLAVALKRESVKWEFDLNASYSSQNPTSTLVAIPQEEDIFDPESDQKSHSPTPALNSDSDILPEKSTTESFSGIQESPSLEERLKLRLQKRYDWFATPPRGDLCHTFGGSSPGAILSKYESATSTNDTNSPGSPREDPFHELRHRNRSENMSLQETSYIIETPDTPADAVDCRVETSIEPDRPSVEVITIDLKEQGKNSSANEDKRGRSRLRFMKQSVPLGCFTVENYFGQPNK